MPITMNTTLRNNRADAITTFAVGGDGAYQANADSEVA
jgi:hypothetical protein